MSKVAQPARLLRVAVLVRLERVCRRRVAAHLGRDLDARLGEALLHDLSERSTLKSVDVGQMISYFIGCASCAYWPVVAGRPGSRPRLRVAELVEHPVPLLAVVLERPEVRVLHLAGDVSGEALDERRIAVEDDSDDPLAVDAHGERLLHLRVEQLLVLRLTRIRVPRDVRRLGPRYLVDDEVLVSFRTSTALNGTWSTQSRLSCWSSRSSSPSW